MRIEMYKTCRRCKAEKNIEAFCKDKRCTGGYKNLCKSCKNEARQKKYAMDEKYREKYKKEQRDWYKKNKSYCVMYKKQYYQQNLDKVLEAQRNYYLKNKQEINRKMSEYVRARLKNDPLFRFKHNVRTVIRKTLTSKKMSKFLSTEDILCCNVQQLLVHIERQFLPGMSWDNRGEWHIDHIIPLATAETEEDVIRLNHYTNLRPLWAKDNLSKGAKIETLL